MTTTLTDVCRELRVIGYACNEVHTGGGCKGLSVADGKAIVGNSCGWGADLYVDDDWTRSVNLHDDIHDTDDAQQIAVVLHQSILASHCGEPGHKFIGKTADELPSDFIPRTKYRVTEIVQYDVLAESRKDACRIVTEDPNRDSYCRDVTDRYAQELDSDDNIA